MAAPLQNGSVSDASADVSTLSWLNVLLGSVWPKANTAMVKYVHDHLTPRLQEILPGPFKRAHFSRFSLGKRTPEFGPIAVQRHSDTHVQIELEMRYFSDVDVLVETGTPGLSFGINQLTFVGRLCIALKPLLQHRPVIGGVHVFFATPPKVELQFAGLAEAVNEVPGLKKKVHAAVDDFFKNTMVLPKMKSFHFTRDEQVIDLTQASSHPPLGVLRARVVSAKNLAGANFQVMGDTDRFTSDPYCVLRLGSFSVTTSTVPGTADPTWPAKEPSAYFVVYHHEQELHIDVCQQLSGNILKRSLVSHLGCLPPTSVRDLLLAKQKSTAPSGAPLTVALDTSHVNRAMLHVNDPVNRGVPSELHLELEWYDLLGDQGESANGMPFQVRFDSTIENPHVAEPMAVLLIELHMGAGFPEEVVAARKALRWQCSVTGEPPSTSRRGDLHFKDTVYDLPLDPRLYHVIDQLCEYQMSIAEIADICEVDPQVIASYLQKQHEAKQQAEEQARETGEERCVELKWHETVAVVVRRPAESLLILELMEGDKGADGSGEVVGRLDPINLAQLMRLGGIMKKALFRLHAVESEKSQNVGFFASMLFPSCNKPDLAPRHRYRAVRMNLSCRMQPLVPGSLPRTLTAISSPQQQQQQQQWQQPGVLGHALLGGRQRSFSEPVDMLQTGGAPFSASSAMAAAHLPQTSMPPGPGRGSVTPRHDNGYSRVDSRPSYDQHAIGILPSQQPSLFLSHQAPSVSSHSAYRDDAFLAKTGSKPLQPRSASLAAPPSPGPPPQVMSCSSDAAVVMSEPSPMVAAAAPSASSFSAGTQRVGGLPEATAAASQRATDSATAAIPGHLPVPPPPPRPLPPPPPRPDKRPPAGQG
eukprot:TRINITY_DN12912_c0_g1_i1.p1 TRINITY_DN12912_c0_g1~~TRINITY_DN12912_c0_g1_i1.p1  ORF type:complete len:916 (+),score=140.07 TRINITY_DN12912_c0_g1_i1:136-2748(+)